MFLLTNEDYVRVNNRAATCSGTGKGRQPIVEDPHPGKQRQKIDEKEEILCFFKAGFSVEDCRLLFLELKSSSERSTKKFIEFFFDKKDQNLYSRYLRFLAGWTERSRKEFPKIPEPEPLNLETVPTQLAETKKPRRGQREIRYGHSANCSFTFS
jgi:hypothetical protein